MPVNQDVPKRLFYGNSADRKLELDGVTHLELALFSVVGLYLICISAVDSVYWATFFYYIKHMEYGESAFTPEYRASLVSSAAQLVLGVFLLLRSRGVLKLIARLRG
jgi:hypothetical protein